MRSWRSYQLDHWHKSDHKHEISLKLFSEHFIFRYDERKIFLFVGIIPLTLARILMFPFGPKNIQMRNSTDETPARTYEGLLLGQASSYNYTIYLDPRAEPLPLNQDCEVEGNEPGCIYEWCETQLQLNFIQFLFGFLAVFLFYPYCIGLCQSIYSKVLGPRPQV